MTDCGLLFNQRGQLQSQIDSDENSLRDPHFCDNVPVQQCAKDRRELQQEIDQLTSQINQLDSQLSPICTLVLGTWQIDANGFQSQLNITLLDNTGGPFQGTVFGDNVNGSWSGGTPQIIFTRQLSGGATQFYTGFLIPYVDPNGTAKSTLVGTFTESDIPGQTFGWFAQH
jgi:hypothetical protein